LRLFAILSAADPFLVDGAFFKVVQADVHDDRELADPQDLLTLRVIFVDEWAGHWASCVAGRTYDTLVLCIGFSE
jgi:hypothetical protein